MGQMTRSFSVFRLTGILVAISFSLLVYSCGSNKTAEVAPNTGTASVAFSVNWEPPPVSPNPAKAKEAAVRPMAPAIDICEDYGLVDINVAVFQVAVPALPLGIEVQKHCNDNSATIGNIPAGDNNLFVRITGSPGPWIGDSESFKLGPGEVKNLLPITVRYKGNDNTPPSISDVTPKDTATHVLNNSTIRVVFSEAMAINTVEYSGTIVVTDNVFGPVPGVTVYNPSDYSATFTPNAPLASGAKVSVTVTDNATDMVGLKLASPMAWSFTAHVPGAFVDPVLLENIDLGDSTYPQIALDGNGNAIVVWQKNIGTRWHIWANRYSASTQSWSSAIQLETNNSGSGVSPKIVMDGNGNAITVWAQSDGTFGSVWANRYSVSTNTWSGAFLLELDNNGSAGPSGIAMDGNGNAIVVWTGFDGIRNNIWVNWYSASAQTWSGSIPLEIGDNNAVATGVAMNGDGDAIVAWHQSDGTVNNIWANRYSVSTKTWSGKFLLENNAGTAEFPETAIDGNGNMIVVWYQSDGIRYSIWANRYSASTHTWGGAFLLENSNNNALPPQIAMNRNGDAIVGWKQSNGAVNDAWANLYSAATQTWSGAFLLETMTGDAEYPSLAMGNTGDAIAVWNQSDGIRDNLWANRYTASTQKWTGAFLLETNNAGHAGVPTVGVGGDGNVFVAWGQQATGNQTQYSIWANRTY